jgi:hypothetical protein
VFRFLWASSLLLVTGLGVWLASSLVAFAGGPPVLACIGGVLLFPVLPLWWEKRATDAFYAQLRRATRLLPKKRALTGPTRVALRTVFINLVFVGALLALWPRVAFAALATNGDWFLGDEKGPWVDRARSVLVASSSGLEWLHRAANDNPYRTKEDEQQPVPDDVKPMEVTTRFGSGQRWRRPDPSQTKPGPTDRDPDPLTKLGPDDPDPDPLTKLGPNDPDPDPPTKLGPNDPDPEPRPRTPDPEPVVSGWRIGDTHWPWTQAVHPVVQGMTPDQELDIATVARTISSRTTDPFERVKALHDWVVTRLTYDHDSVTGPRKRQDAQAVFLSRLGVCEGYARLMVEFGKHTGDRIVYVTGDVREDTGELAPVGHAWNAVEIRGAWYLMDVTWDDPTIEGQRASNEYRTDYLFIPPEFMGLNHFPDEARWQLRDQRLSRAAFLRQPLATPRLAKEQMTLISPERPVVDVDDRFDVTLDNPTRTWVMLTLGGKECGKSNDARVTLSCPVSSEREAVVFTNKEEYGRFGQLISFKLR